MTTMFVYLCSYLLRLYAVEVVPTDVQVFDGRASFERKVRRFVRMDELCLVLSLVLGYWEYWVVGPVYDRYRQGFQHILPRPLALPQPARERPPTRAGITSFPVVLPTATDATGALALN